MKIFSFKERVLQILAAISVALALIYMAGGFESANTTQPTVVDFDPDNVREVTVDIKKKKLLIGPWKYTYILEDDEHKAFAGGFVDFTASGELAEIIEMRIFGPDGGVALEFSLRIEGKWSLVKNSIFYSSIDISIIPSASGPQPPYTSSDISEMEAEMESSPTKILKIDDCVMLVEEDGELNSYNKYYYDSNGNLKPKC